MRLVTMTMPTNMKTKRNPLAKHILNLTDLCNSLFAEQQKDSEQDRYMCRDKKYDLVVPNGLDTVPVWMRDKANVSAEYGRIQNEIYSKFPYGGDMDDLFRERLAQDFVQSMEQIGMSEEDYMRLLNLTNRLKTDSANNNQGDQDQGLEEKTEVPQSPFQQSISTLRGASALLSRRSDFE